MPDFNYSRGGWYFVTICTNYRQNHFGQIVDNKTVLSKIGKITQQCWLDIPKHFVHTRLGQFVIMPDHIHGIIIMDGIIQERDAHVRPLQFVKDKGVDRSKMLLPKIIHDLNRR